VVQCRVHRLFSDQGGRSARVRRANFRAELVHVDVVNTFRGLPRSFRVVSRTFAWSIPTFPQVSVIYAAGSIPAAPPRNSSSER
jgi:hypothetical protein